MLEIWNLKNKFQIFCGNRLFRARVSKYVQLISIYETEFVTANHKWTLCDKVLKVPRYSDDLQREYLAGIILHDLLPLSI